MFACLIILAMMKFYMLQLLQQLSSESSPPVSPRGSDEMKAIYSLSLSLSHTHTHTHTHTQHTKEAASIILLMLFCVYFTPNLVLNI